ncbi:MAG: hypothetical protein WBG76_00845 [Ornithinimicrobium sp.]
MKATSQTGVYLARTKDRRSSIADLTSRLGERVGIPGVLADLNRTAVAADPPGSAVRWGFTWNSQDNDSDLWWPQGITTSADATDVERVEDRSVLLTSWYCKGGPTDRQGSRITVVDLETLRYRHVLIVQAVTSWWGGTRLKPLHIHAGGLVWAGDHFYLAGTRRGLFTCHADDIIKLEPGDHTFDYRYVLPVRFAYQAGTEMGHEALRYSFLSLHRGATPPELIAGEYGRDTMTTRVARYELDPQSLLLDGDDDGRSHPVFLDDRGVGHMQGATVVEDRFYVTASRGRRKDGHVYVGQPGDLARHEGVLPPGPEDITYWPSRDQLWSLSEYPQRRFVFAMDRSQFD